MDSANIDLTGSSTAHPSSATHLVYPSFFSSSMGPTFGARHVVQLLQITRSKVESKSENSYIRHYLQQQLSPDYRQGTVTRPNAERTNTRFPCVADALKFEFWAKIKKKEETGNVHGDIQSSQRKRGFLTLSPTVLIWWDNTARALGWNYINPFLTAINVFM